MEFRTETTHPLQFSDHSDLCMVSSNDTFAGGAGTKAGSFFFFQS
jgi:hypothetical protein